MVDEELEEDVVLTSAAAITMLLHQENVDKDVDCVGCVSLGHSVNFKVLESIQSVHAGVEVEFDFDASVDGP